VTAFQKAIALMAEDRKASRSTEAYRGLAIAYVGLGRFKEAISVLEKAVREFPQDGGARAALADAHLAMGDIDGAIAEAEKRLQIEPTSEARLELAALYARKRVSAKAEPLYQTVLKERPEDLAAALGLADLYLAKGDYAAAERVLGRAKDRHPDDTGVLSRLGVLHSRRGRPDLALSELEQLVRRDPTQLEAKAELGSLYFRGGDSDTAVKVLKSVIATDSRQPLAHMYLGQVLFERGQPGEAEKAFKASLAVDPSFGAPHFYLGQLYESQDRKKDALREYREAVVRQSDLAPAVEAVKRLEKQVAAEVPTQGNAGRPAR
jgi:tetratricopeptide (TPR) repeat protein